MAMRKFLLILACVSLPFSASAGQYQDEAGMWWTTIDPPEKWLSEPYFGTIEVTVLPKAQLAEKCFQLVNQAEPHGCADLGYLDCIIYISADLPPPMWTNIYEHELAHCHGWPSDHPLVSDGFLEMLGSYR